MAHQDTPGKVKIDEQEFSRDGNAYALMGCWSKEARRQDWSKAQRDEVLARCISGDYDNLLQTLLSVTELA